MPAPPSHAPPSQPSTLTKWKYRAVYRVDDQRYGQWSAEAGVTLGG